MGNWQLLSFHHRITEAHNHPLKRALDPKKSLFASSCVLIEPILGGSDFNFQSVFLGEISLYGFFSRFLQFWPFLTLGTFGAGIAQKQEQYYDL